LLFDLILVAFPFQQFRKERQVVIAVVFVSDFEKRYGLELTLRVAEHLLVDGVGRQHAAFGIEQDDADR